MTGTVICTLGMHRSGTSVVSRLLNLLGVYLGPDQWLSYRASDNPKGHWEHPRIRLLNEEILARFEGSWDEPPAFPPSWPDDPRVADLKVEASQIIIEDFSSAPLWGWKDPRTCLTLPFWQDLIGPMRYVICLRNPCAVASSLGDRDRINPEQIEPLWATYVRSSLDWTSGQPRLLVVYDELIDDCMLHLQRLAAFIGRPDQGDDPDVRASVHEFVEPELRHHRVSEEGMASDPRISAATKTLFADLTLERGIA